MYLMQQATLPFQFYMLDMVAWLFFITEHLAKVKQKRPRVT